MRNRGTTASGNSSRCAADQSGLACSTQQSVPRGRPGLELFRATQDSGESWTNAPSHGTSSRSTNAVSTAQHGEIGTPLASIAKGVRREQFRRLRRREGNDQGIERAVLGT